MPFGAYSENWVFFGADAYSQIGSTYSLWGGALATTPEVHRGGRAVAHPQLPQDVLDMDLHGRLTEHQARGNVPVAQAFGQQRQDPVSYTHLTLPTKRIV